MGKPAAEVATSVNKHTFPLSAKNVVDRVPKSTEWVLIGEASHGTREFYDLRAEITKELITNRGFHAVATEADFPDAFRANLWVRGLSDDKSVEEALSEFKRFPTWMWRNKTIVRFLDWMHGYNSKLGGPEEERRLRSVGFYGMDVYSLSASTQAVVSYLERVDHEAARVAKERYSCFDRYGSDAMVYGLALRHGMKTCEEEAVKELVDIRKKVAQRRAQAKGRMEEEEWDFAALANAMVVKDAETYYRSMYFSDEISWNIRDRHMVATAKALRKHLQKRGIANPRIVVWAHNSHLGDARYTDMGMYRGEVNVGQLLREAEGERHPEAVANIGFTTHTGTVAAADEWDSPVKNKRVNPSLSNSYEHVMHLVRRPAFGVQLTEPQDGSGAAGGRGGEGGPGPEARAAVNWGLKQLRNDLHGPRLQRAIGVIYRPDTERYSHYFQVILPEQFDILLHIDTTHAVQPLDPGAAYEEDKEAVVDAPETYPFGV